MGKSVNCPKCGRPISLLDVYAKTVVRHTATLNDDELTCGDFHICDDMEWKDEHYRCPECLETLFSGKHAEKAAKLFLQGD